MLELAVQVADALALPGHAALVVPANKQLRLGWGSHVAEAVLARAGPGVEREALAARPGGVALGEAVLTSAGGLGSYTHLVHAAVLDQYDFNPLFMLRLRERTSEATLRAATRSALEAVAAAGLGSVVLTPMGAGIGGMSDARCARFMAEELRRFERERPEAALRVTVACRGERTARAFRAALGLPG